MASNSDVQETMDTDDNQESGKSESKDSSGTVSDPKNPEKKPRTENSYSQTRNKRQILKDDSGISVEKSENSTDNEDEDGPKKVRNGCSSKNSTGESSLSSLFPNIRRNSKSRNYRKRISEDASSDEEVAKEDSSNSVKVSDGRSSPDSGNHEKPSLYDDMEQEDNELTGRNTPDSPLDSTKRSDSENENSTHSTDNEDENEQSPTVLLKEKPKHKWFVMQEIVNRQRGTSSRLQGDELFQQRCYGSLHAVQRLELMYKLEAHNGCVNALHFNQRGNMLASGSDDLNVVIWDWAVGKPITRYESGHKSNVFQVKFLPLHYDTHIISCGRDGYVMLAELSSTGVCRSTRRLAQHRGPAHKLSLQAEVPHEVLSSGEDGVVLSIDVRTPKPTRLIQVKDGGEKKIGLYGIHSNPLNHHEFLVCGRDRYIRLYDKRRISENDALKKFCPKHLVNANCFAHVTCAVFNHNGTEILGSYNDEDIYLFDTRNSDGTEYIHKYEGHRNSATVKGLSFFGPRSEFIVSGSDCGNIFFWDKSTEAIVQWMPADENGVVNCLEPHPQFPVIATSGLDDDVKIWVPSCEVGPVMHGLQSTVIANQKARDADSLDGQMLWVLWSHIRQTDPRRSSSRWSRPDVSEEVPAANADSSSSDSNHSSDADDGYRIQCSPS